MTLVLSISLVLAYFIGSVPFAYVYGKYFRKIDIRQHGSGNVGATNVLRVFGKKAGIVVLLLDILKGYLPVMIAMHFVSPLPVLSEGFAEALPVLVGIFAILGHTFTVFLSFKGGKGVATSAGVFLALSPLTIACALLIFTIVVLITKYVSLGSMVAAVFLVITHLMIFLRSDSANPYIFYFAILLSLFIIYKHKSNITRLIKGTENKIKFDK